LKRERSVGREKTRADSRKRNISLLNEYTVRVALSRRGGSELFTVKFTAVRKCTRGLKDILEKRRNNSLRWG
jgi:hypothetical protein